MKRRGSVFKDNAENTSMVTNRGSNRLSNHYLTVLNTSHAIFNTSLSTIMRHSTHLSSQQGSHLLAQVDDEASKITAEKHGSFNREQMDDESTKVSLQRRGNSRATLLNSVELRKRECPINRVERPLLFPGTPRAQLPMVREVNSERLLSESYPSPYLVTFPPSPAIVTPLTSVILHRDCDLSVWLF